MLDKIINDYYGLRGRAGEIGLELELEKRSGNWPDHLLKHWVAHHDNSLRHDGIEWVLTSPIAYGNVNKALTELFDAFEKSKAVFDVNRRTSTHVHVNVQKMYFQEVYTLIALYFIVEELLIEFSGPERVGNLFCLRSSDAEVLPLLLAKDIRTGKGFNSVANDRYRYASLNLAAITKFGSVEFRSFRGSVDKQEILEWVNIVYSLKKAAYLFDNPRDVLDYFNATKPADFLKSIFGPVSERLMQIEGWEQSLERGSVYAFEIAYAKDKWKDIKKKRQGIPEVQEVIDDPWDDAGAVGPDPEFARRRQIERDQLFNQAIGNGALARNWQVVQPAPINWEFADAALPQDPVRLPLPPNEDF